MKSKIYIKHWKLLKPENLSSKTDLYYLKIANKIYNNLRATSNFILKKYIHEEDIKLLCCFLTCYFEDVISEVNIWATFKNLYKDLYNKTLPFYTITENYEDDEINAEDLAFLVWYYLNTVQDEKFIHALNPFILDIANDTLDILDEEYEYAPENTNLKAYFTFKDVTADFYATRAFIQQFSFDAYLFFTDFKQRLTQSLFELFDNKNFQNEDPTAANSYVTEITEDFTFNKKSALLALAPKDWVAAFVGSDHALHETIAGISKKILGFFFFKYQNDTAVVLEHIASGMLFEMTKESFDHEEDLTEDGIIFIGLVKWNNAWWFSGNFIVSAFDADLILDQKNSAEARAAVNFLHDTDEMNSILKLQEDAFLKYNNNNHLAFINARDVQKFTSEFMEFFNELLDLSEEEIEAALSRAKADSYFGKETTLLESDSDDEGVVVYFNPKSGLEIYTDVLNAFPDKNNPFFSKENPQEVTYLLLDNGFSTEFTYHFINTYKKKLKFFKSEINKNYLENIDFLMRFWKKDAYETQSKLVLTGKNHGL